MGTMIKCLVTHSYLFFQCGSIHWPDHNRGLCPAGYMATKCTRQLRFFCTKKLHFQVIILSCPAVFSTGRDPVHLQLFGQVMKFLQIYQVYFNML